MKMKRNELNAVELIETIGGVSVTYDRFGGGIGGMPVYVGGTTVNISRPDLWDTYDQRPKYGRP